MDRRHASVLRIIGERRWRVCFRWMFVVRFGGSECGYQLRVSPLSIAGWWESLAGLGDGREI